MDDAALREVDAARLVGLSRRTLQRWRLLGISPFKPLTGFGRNIRYSRAAILAYINGGA